MRVYRLDRAHRQHRAKRKRHIGGAEILKHHSCQRERQALPSGLLRAIERPPSTINIGLVGLAVTLGQCHASVSPGRTDCITDPIEWGKLTLREGCGTFEDCVDNAFVDPAVFGENDRIENKTLFGNLVPRVVVRSSTASILRA